MPAPALELRPTLPPTLSRIAEKLLQKSPEDRYQTADALGRDLRECREQLLRSGTISSHLVLATADTQRWFASRCEQFAWVVFYALMSAALLSLSRKWRRPLAAVAACAAGFGDLLRGAGAVGHDLVDVVTRHSHAQTYEHPRLSSARRCS